jgi:hypothetical protein
MPKSRKRKRSGSHASGSGEVNWGGASKGGVSTKLIIGIVATLVFGSGGMWLWNTAQASREFDELAGAGGDVLARVQTQRDDGQRHLNYGESFRYSHAYPTSGPHAPQPTRPGYYTEVQPPVGLVHALEHGAIVIYYGEPGPETVARLKDWTGLYQGVWDGVVAAPRPGLGQGVMLNAWRKRLPLKTFDAKSAAAFIDAYRGRGPENPVR